MLTPTWPLGAHRHPLPDSADRSPLAHAGRIAAFLEALDLRDVIFLGNDTGGALCQLVVAHHSERVGALVLTVCGAALSTLLPDEQRPSGVHGGRTHGPSVSEARLERTHRS